MEREQQECKQFMSQHIQMSKMHWQISARSNKRMQPDKVPATRALCR
jgi:hypothetical protein